MKQLQKGFTLIELMIVVAIIGILAAVAIPAYQDYVIKAKLSKVSSTIDPLKLAIAMYYQEQGSFVATANPWTSLGLAGAPTIPAEVASVDVAANTNAITLVLQNIGTNINAESIIMTPTAGTSAITWANTCTGAILAGTGNGAVAKKYFGC